MRLQLVPTPVYPKFQHATAKFQSVKFNAPDKADRATFSQQRSGNIIGKMVMGTFDIIFNGIGCAFVVGFWGTAATLGFAGLATTADYVNQNMLDGTCQDAFGKVEKQLRPQLLNKTQPNDPKLLEKLKCASQKGFLKEVTPEKSYEFMKHIATQKAPEIPNHIQEALRIQMSKKLVP